MRIARKYGVPLEETVITNAKHGRMCLYLWSAGSYLNSCIYSILSCALSVLKKTNRKIWEPCLQFVFYSTIHKCNIEEQAGVSTFLSTDMQNTYQHTVLYTASWLLLLHQVHFSVKLLAFRHNPLY